MSAEVLDLLKSRRIERLGLLMEVSRSEEEPSPELIHATNLEAQRLLSAAQDPGSGAHEFIERFLYVVNRSNRFMPPLDGVVSMAWGVLSRAKLRQAFQNVERERARTKAEMKRELEELVTRLGAHRHPLIGDVVADPDGRALLVYSKNWVGSTEGFTNQLLCLAQHLSERPTQIVLSNIADEFRGTTHNQLRERFYNEIGLRTDALESVRDPDRVTESFHLLNFRTVLNAHRNPLRSLGAFYSIESNFTPECKRMLDGLRKRGMDEHALEIFSTHVETDERHTEEWLEILDAAELTDEDRAEVVLGARVQLHTRNRMFDAVRRYLYPNRVHQNG